MPNICTFALNQASRCTRMASSVKYYRTYYKGSDYSSRDENISTRYEKRKISDPVIISATHPYYTNGYESNKDQLVLTRVKSGNNSKFSLLIMKDLMAMMNLKSHA